MTRENTGHVDEPNDGEEERRGHVDEPQREDEGQADVPEDLANGLPVEYKLLETIEEFDWDGAYKRDPVFQKIDKKCSTNNEDHDGYSISGSLLQFTTSKGIRTCIPTTLLREVLHIAHDTLGHGGYKKTYDRITANYYRPKLAAYVEDYVARCPKCAVNKTARSKLVGNLLPIDAMTSGVPLGAFECVGMDFIVQLPKSEGFDAIMVIIDKFTRYGILIPMTSDYTAVSSAEAFVKHVVAQGWLPSKFITDRDKKFLSDFWQGIITALSIRHKSSTTYHAQTDGATERLNQIIEAMLRAYLSPLQDDWVKWLHLVELAYNTAKNVSTGEAPVALLYAQPHDILKRLLDPKDIGINPQKESVEEWLEKIRNKILDAQESIRYATLLQKKYYDDRHSPLEQYKLRDYASLRLDKHPTSVRHNKLSMQKLPPYKIVRVLSNGRAVELELPPTMRGIHPVLSVQQLEKAKNPHEDPWRRDHARPPAVEEDVFEAEIIGERTSPTGQRTYKIHWIGYPLDEAQWVREGDVAPATVQQWKERLAHRLSKRTTMAVSSAISHQQKTFEYEITIPEKSKKVERPVVYISRNTKSFERNYESTERELACAVWAFIKLCHLLEGSKTILITDHASIKEIL